MAMLLCLAVAPPRYACQAMCIGQGGFVHDPAVSYAAICAECAHDGQVGLAQRYRRRG
jgi:hypothetical protein